MFHSLISPQFLTTIFVVQRYAGNNILKKNAKYYRASLVFFSLFVVCH